MLTQLSTVKSRLAIPGTDTTNDALLTTANKAASARFDKETNRTLARTESATFEFDIADTDLSPPCYPVESVTKFETKTSEADGWQEITPAPDYLIRQGCIISLAAPLNPQPSTLNSPRPIARVTYTAGYYLPGDPGYQQSTINYQLPPDLENACIEQCAFWFTNRERLGLKTYWPSGLAYYQFATQDLLESVRSVLSSYRRWSL